MLRAVAIRSTRLTPVGASKSVIGVGLISLVPSERFSDLLTGFPSVSRPQPVEPVEPVVGSCRRAQTSSASGGRM